MNAIDIKERLQEIKGSVSAAVWKEALGLLADAKPKRVLTEEHKAKMQAGRVAKKAAKAAESVESVESAKPVKAKKAAKVTEAEVAEKPKRVLTEEHKAKMQAGRAAKKAAKAAEAAEPVSEPVAATLSEKPKRVLTEEHKAKMQAGRKAKKEAKAAEPAVVEDVKEGMIEIAGVRYLRLADGRCYSVCSEDGEISEWAGMFKNGVLDTTVAEP
jgi:hypothetical protein